MTSGAEPRNLVGKLNFTQLSYSLIDFVMNNIYLILSTDSLTQICYLVFGKS